MFQRKELPAELKTVKCGIPSSLMDSFCISNEMLSFSGPVLCLVDESVFTCSKPWWWLDDKSETCSKPWWCSQTLPARPCPTASVGHPHHSRWSLKLWHFLGQGRMSHQILFSRKSTPMVFLYSVVKIPLQYFWIIEDFPTAPLPTITTWGGRSKNKHYLIAIYFLG